MNNDIIEFLSILDNEIKMIYPMHMCWNKLSIEAREIASADFERMVIAREYLKIANIDTEKYDNILRKHADIIYEMYDFNILDILNENSVHNMYSNKTDERIQILH